MQIIKPIYWNTDWTTWHNTNYCKYCNQYCLQDVIEIKKRKTSSNTQNAGQTEACTMHKHKRTNAIKAVTVYTAYNTRGDD